MYRTYELYVEQPDGHVRFEALTFRGATVEVMRHVRAMVETTGARSIEVRSGGEPLFTLLGSETET